MHLPIRSTAQGPHCAPFTSQPSGVIGTGGKHSLQGRDFSKLTS